MAMRNSYVAIPLCAIAFALSIVSCGASTAGDTAESLARNPQRLQVVLRECRAKIAQFAHLADDPICRAASEAWRRRFFGDPATTKAKPGAGASPKNGSAILPEKATEAAPRIARS